MTRNVENFTFFMIKSVRIKTNKINSTCCEIMYKVKNSIQQLESFAKKINIYTKKLVAVDWYFILRFGVGFYENCYKGRLCWYDADIL